MNVAGPRVLAVSLGSALALSVVTGSLYAWLADKVWSYAVGTMMFIIGAFVLALGLLGAIEPPEGWASTRKKQEGRRSMAMKVVEQNPGVEAPSGWALAVWGVVVGGPLIGLSLWAFAAAV